MKSCVKAHKIRRHNHKTEVADASRLCVVERLLTHRFGRAGNVAELRLLILEDLLSQHDDLQGKILILNES